MAHSSIGRRVRFQRDKESSSLSWVTMSFEDYVKSELSAYRYFQEILMMNKFGSSFEEWFRSYYYEYKVLYGA